MVGAEQRWLVGACVALVVALGAPRAAAQESGLALSTPRPSAPSVSVVAARTHGIDPVVGEHVTTRMMLSAQALGYLLVDSASVQAAQRALGVPAGADARALLALAQATDSARAISAWVYADQGRYVVELLVASADGRGPFRVAAYASAERLHEVVEALVRQALPPPGVWDAEGAARLAAGGAHPATAPLRPGAPPTPPPPALRWGVGLQTEAAIGTGAQHDFYNHLVGLRFDVFLTRAIALGAYLGYVNLEGRAGRVSSLAGTLGIEGRVRIRGVRALSLPLRVAGGYVLGNGALVRLSAGINVAFSPQLELGVDLFAPTFWHRAPRLGVSFDPALELRYRFGAALP